MTISCGKRRLTLTVRMSNFRRRNFRDRLRRSNNDTDNSEKDSPLVTLENLTSDKTSFLLTQKKGSDFSNVQKSLRQSEAYLAETLDSRFHDRSPSDTQGQGVTTIPDSPNEEFNPYRWTPSPRPSQELHEWLSASAASKSGMRTLSVTSSYLV